MWQSLVLFGVAEATLSTEQLAAGLIVGDPVLQVFWQLRGLHLEGDRKLSLQRANCCCVLRERHNRGTANEAAALLPLRPLIISCSSL